MKTYTVIVGRPDYVSDNQLADTYMTSLEAENALAAGDAACQECLDVDDHSDAVVEDYVIVAVIAGDHPDISGREDV